MSQYVVSARKYRPATFASVVGQGHVTDTLIHSLQSGQVAHAYLFCGPRGVGKTTVARILAKAVNCENLTAEGEACGECASCKAFDTNSSFTIFELDAASNNSVDDIRMLVDQVRVPPSMGKYKVYIIDEVHMLTTQAFNAFLKTLEEPPPYVRFILATTEKHKILPTILSRCQAFDFRRIPVPEIAAHLRSICDKESIAVEDEALVIIAQKGDGSLRDSLSIFDRIASQSKGNITYAGVLDSLQLLDYDYFFKVTDALLREDMTGVFLTLADIQKRGFEGEAFLSGFSEHLRDLLLCKDTATAGLLTHGDKIKARYLHQAEAIRKSSLVTYIDQVNQCELSYARALNKWLHIEMALVRMCYTHRRVEDPPGNGAETEKKKPDVSTAQVSRVATAVTSSSNTETNSTGAIEAGLGEKAKPEPNVAVRTATENRATAAAPAVDLPKPPIISLKPLGELKKKAVEELAEEKSAVPVLSLSEINAFWQRYAEEHTSPSVRQTMQEAILDTPDERTIEVKTGNQTGKNRLVAETNLIDGLRAMTRIPDLQITFRIDPALDRTKEILRPKKLLSSREIFEIMAAKNPLLHELRSRLDLAPDED